jgi:hypothetical protein
MLRKAVGAAVILVLCVGVALADEIRAVITKVEDNKVTFFPIEGKGKDAKKGEEKTMTAVKDVKVVKGKFDKEAMKFVAGDPIEGGLKNEMFTKIGDKGRGALLITDADNKKITEIRVFKGKGKKKD